ncbi:MAG: molybdopterin synthase catalytic subunit [Nocardioidaceae bacterium]|nr:molybdopterin synthase catalytic subunit [Nocardioidaceae bacterium]
MPDQIRLLAVQETPIDITAVYSAVGDPAVGGVALFVGTVRDHDGGQDVASLDYSAHPRVEATLRQVASDVVERYEVTSLAAVHRVGRLAIGDVAVVTAVGCAHRGQAFDACRALIDELKHRLPIWKHQLFSDGGEEWVGTP